jgi:hypothetical protein
MLSWRKDSIDANGCQLGVGRIREVRDMIRAGGAQTAASEEPAEAIAALDDLLDRFK